MQTMRTRVTWMGMGMGMGVALMLLGSAHEAHAQACSQAQHHWRFDEYYHYQTWQAVCDPNRLSPIELYDCDDVFWRNFPDTYYTPGGEDIATIGLVGIDLLTNSGKRWSGMVPVACVVPRGGTPERNGRIFFVHSPRYNASDPSIWSSSYSTLRATTSMCFEGGNDTINVAKASFRCGACGFPVEPFNYNGYRFYLSGQEGHDRLTGGLGADVLIGGNDNDTVTGDKSADQLRGDAGNDFLYGNAADDYYLGGIGNDWLSDSAGYRDALYGGDGSDCFFDSQSATVDGQAGTDICTAATRAGAASLTSCETSWGWCIPE